MAREMLSIIYAMEFVMSKININAIPELADGVRLCWEEEESAYILLYPEGMVVLDLPTSSLLLRCDGYLSITEIQEQLRQEGMNTANRQQVMQCVEQGVRSGWITLS